MKHQKLKTTPEISKRMANVKLKRESTETQLAKALLHNGYRYRLNYRKLPGFPDIALTAHKVAIFIRKPQLNSNREYWIKKIEKNIDRDARNDLLLQNIGWTTIHLWEKEIKHDFEKCLLKILSVLKSI